MGVFSQFHAILGIFMHDSRFRQENLLHFVLRALGSFLVKFHPILSNDYANSKRRLDQETIGEGFG